MGQDQQQAQSDSDQTASPSLPPPHTCSAAECAITKVLETPELLEIVLSFMGTSDVLAVRRINSKWQGVTQNSPLLKLHYFVNPQWNRHPKDYELLDLNLPGLTIASSDPVDMGRWIKVTMTRAAASQICPNGGSRSRALSVHEGLRGLRKARESSSNSNQPEQQPSHVIASQLKHEDLHIVQPPIVGLQAFAMTQLPAAGPSNEPQGGSKPRAIAKIHCNTGITLGFLAEAVLRLLNNGDDETDDTNQYIFKAIISFAPPEAKSKKRDGRRSVVRI